MTVFEAGLRWWLALTVVAVALAPLSWWLTAGLGSFRHALIRPVGLVLGTFALWWPAALLPIPFQRATVIGAIIVAGAAGWTLLWLRGRDLLSGYRALLAFEIAWLVAFGTYLWFRSTNPDIANTEKPMEIALLASIVRSGDVPAPDPWFAGEPINYYYFGYQTVATLGHMSGVKSTVAFNLALGMLFASTLVGAAGLGGWLASRADLGRRAQVAAAALAGFFVALAGNLETTIRLLREPRATISAGWWDGIGWQASRVIVDTGVNGDPNPHETINEFPAFSFVLGDLHPHVTTLPALLAAIALAAGLALDRELITLPRAAVVGGFAGLLYASNSWDAPVGVVAVLGAILLAYRQLDREVLARTGAAVGGAAIAALPFALNYTAPVGVDTGSVPEWFTRIPVLGSLPNTIAVVTWRPSSTSELLTVYGVWIVAFAMFGVWAAQSSAALRGLVAGRGALLLPAGLVLLAGAVAWAPGLILLGVPALSGLAVAAAHERGAVRLIGALFAAGFGLALVPEFLFIQDAFGNRMNTVFKLGFQAWLFLGIASAAAGLLVISTAPDRWRATAAGLFALLVACAAPYTPLSAEDWTEMGGASGTLDGAAYLRAANPAEAAAIDWLDSVATDSDVLVEAPGCAYQSLGGVPMNRFSAFTGVPAMLGWANHERQWRRGEFDDLAGLTEAVEARREIAESWLSGIPVDGEPQPRFVIFGVIERATSERCPQLVARGEQEIERLRSTGWEVAFQQGQTVILVAENDPLAASGN